MSKFKRENKRVVWNFTLLDFDLKKSEHFYVERFVRTEDLLKLVQYLVIQYHNFYGYHLHRWQSDRFFIRCAVVHHGKLMKLVQHTVDDEVMALKHLMRDKPTHVADPNSSELRSRYQRIYRLAHDLVDTILRWVWLKKVISLTPKRVFTRFSKKKKTVLLITKRYPEIF